MAMNGGQSLIRALADAGVTTCFMNPGTSEMHFVASLDAVPEMRSVLALFEGVATGAADGYGRMHERPAATLLHLGPGLANGIANLHNARRAATPIVNIVGDHAGYHKGYDAPLESDVEGLARPVSGWYRSTSNADEVATDAIDAIAAAMGPPGCVATLVLPADVSWTEAGAREAPQLVAPQRRVDTNAVGEVAKLLRTGEPCVLLIGGAAMRAAGLAAANRVAAAATNTKLFSETFPARLERGAGIAPVERLAYLAEFTAMQIGDARHMILAGTKAPVSFFAYPGKPSDLTPEGCTVHSLATTADDVVGALEALADELGAANDAAPYAALSRPALPNRAMSPSVIAEVIGALMPEGAILADESNTAGIHLAGATAHCPPHDVLTLTGGAIGMGMPLATGAAVACPDRKVICMEADGSAMYTIQSLWTQAREGLDVTTVIYDNRSYGILELELSRVGAEAAGPRAKRMLDIGEPDLDFVSIAQGMGVSASRATTAEELADQVAKAFASEGPTLIQAVLKKGLGLE